MLQCGSIWRLKTGLGSYCARWILNMQEDLLEEFMIPGVRVILLP